MNATMYEDWTDEELVEEILRQKGGDKTAHLDALFWRYFDPFEKTIRAVLLNYGISFSDDETHYNHVFDGIYERVFSPGKFRKIASKFDPARSSSFRGWFIGTVLPDRIIDWLRAKDPASGTNNRTYLTLKYPVHSESELSEKGFESKAPLDFFQGEPDCDQGYQGLEGCIQKLSIEDRILMKLLYWGGASLTEEELSFLVEMKGCKPAEIVEALGLYETNFRNRYEKQFNRAAQIDLALGIKHFMLLRNQKMIHAKMGEMGGLSGSEPDLVRLREKSGGMGLVAVRQEIKKRKKNFPKSKNRTSQRESRIDLIELELTELLVYERKLNRKIDNLFEELERLFLPVNKAVGELMNLTPNAVSRKKISTGSKLKRCLESLRE